MIGRLRAARPINSAVYEGKVTHVRQGPARHLFGYALHMLYLDLDEVDRSLPVGLLRRGRFGWLSFFRDDYLGNPAVPLKQAVLDTVEARLGIRPAGPVRLLTQVRCFGYVFNPVSFYYCFGADEVTLEAIVAEITNTPWKERHAYVLPARDGLVRGSFQKVFHVSPFFGMQQRYRWLLTTPGDRLAVTMVNEEGGRDVFSATLALERHELSPSRLRRLVIRQPFMAWRVHVGIYIQAWKLRRKKATYFEHPSAATPSANLRRDETWRA